MRLPKPCLGHGEHELLARAQLGVALRRQRRFLAALLGILGGLFDGASASSPGARGARRWPVSDRRALRRCVASEW